MEVTEPHTASRPCPSAVKLVDMGHPHNSTRWLPPLWTRKETLSWRVVCSRRKREASRHVLATNIWTIILRRHTGLGGMVWYGGTNA